MKSDIRCSEIYYIVKERIVKEYKNIYQKYMEESEKFTEDKARKLPLYECVEELPFYYY